MATLSTRMRSRVYFLWQGVRLPCTNCSLSSSHSIVLSTSRSSVVLPEGGGGVGDGLVEELQKEQLTRIPHTSQPQDYASVLEASVPYLQDPVYKILTSPHRTRADDGWLLRWQKTFPSSLGGNDIFYYFTLASCQLYTRIIKGP